MNMTNIYKKILVAACAVMSLSFASCELEPYEIPAEEMYLRNFIKKYGLIDPTQDWNMSTPVEVTVVPGKIISKLNVMVECNSGIYRVAEYADVDETVVIPIDVPDGTQQLIVEADGEVLYTTPGGTADFSKTESRSGSRALITPTWDAAVSTTSTYTIPYASWNSSLKYIDLVQYGWGENLHLGDWRTLNDGETFDSSTDAVIANPDYDPSNASSTETIQVRYQDRKAVGSTHAGSKLVINLKNEKRQMYTFSFETGHNESTSDLQVFLINDAGEQFIAREVTISNTGGWALTEKHTFITPILETGNYRVIVYAASAGTSWYADNWGNFNFEPLDYQGMAWLMVAEDLGATDDFDFNDIIIRIECITVNTKIYNQQWQVVTDETQHTVLGNDSRATGESNFKRLRVTAMCAGGTLPLYLHYFEASENKDYIISSKNNVKYEVALTDTRDSYTEHEWHRWFGINDSRIMINTGVSRDHTLSTTVVDNLVTVEFYVGSSFTMAQYSKFIDYDEDRANLHLTETTIPGWNWDQTPTDYVIEGFYITVGGATLASARTALYQPKIGEAPQAFLIPDVGARTYGWEWPTERTDITTVYPDFLEWAKSGGETTNETVLNWYTRMHAGMTADHDYCSREP